MAYTVKQLAQMAGVSERTLRYYDEIGLLCPARGETSGYRQYGSNEVDRLQQILFFRELGLPLETVLGILEGSDYDAAASLEAHLEGLREQKERLERLIANAEKTISTLKGECTMQDTEKFEGFKKQMIDENETRYGEEVRKKYGDAKVNASNAKLMNMTPEEYKKMTALSEELNATLKEAFRLGDPTGEAAQRAAALHKEWLCCHWPNYSPEAHCNLAQMYVDDERFTAYYDKIAPGCAVFLRDAIQHYCSVK